MCCLHSEYRQASAVGCPDTSACFEFHFSNSSSFLSFHSKLAQVWNEGTKQWVRITTYRPERKELLDSLLSLFQLPVQTRQCLLMRIVFSQLLCNTRHVHSSTCDVNFFQLEVYLWNSIVLLKCGAYWLWNVLRSFLIEFFNRNQRNVFVIWSTWKVIKYEIHSW